MGKKKVLTNINTISNTTQHSNTNTNTNINKTQSSSSQKKISKNKVKKYINKIIKNKSLTIIGIPRINNDEKMREENSKLAKQIEEYKNNDKKSKEEIKNLKEEIKNLQEEIKNLEEEITNLKKCNSKLTSQNEFLRENNGPNIVISKNGEFGQSINESYMNPTQRELAEKDEEIYNLKEKLKQSEDQLKSMKKEYFAPSINMDIEASVKEKDEKISNLNKTIESLTKENRDLKLKLLNTNSMQNEIEDLKKVIQEKEKLYSDLNELYQEEVKKSEALKVEMELNEKQAQREDKGGKLKESGFEMNSFNMAMSNNFQLGNSVYESNNSIENLKKKNDELETELMEARKELDMLKMNTQNINKDEFNNLQKQIDNLKYELSEQNEKNMYLQNLNEKLEKENQRAKKYNICMSFIKQAINVWIPTDDKQKFIFQKLEMLANDDENE
jgi:exonuclease SbcC